MPPSAMRHHRPRATIGLVPPPADTRTIRHRATTGHVPPPADTRTTRGYPHHLALCPHHTNARSPRVICKSMACTSVPPQSFIIIPSRRAEYPPPRQSRYWFIPNKRRSTTKDRDQRAARRGGSTAEVRCLWRGTAWPQNPVFFAQTAQELVLTHRRPSVAVFLLRWHPLRAALRINLVSFVIAFLLKSNLRNS